MGLDISFNKQAALDAGLVIISQQRGTPEEIHAAELEVLQGTGDLGYLAWLRSSADFFEVPYGDHFVEAATSKYLKGGLEGIPENWTVSLVVRANKWGNTYDPLTAWLRTNNIEWSEF